MDDLNNNKNDVSIGNNDDNNKNQNPEKGKENKIVLLLWLIARLAVCFVESRNQWFVLRRRDVPERFLRLKEQSANVFWKSVEAKIINLCQGWNRPYENPKLAGRIE